MTYQGFKTRHTLCIARMYCLFLFTCFLCTNAYGQFAASFDIQGNIEGKYTGRIFLSYSPNDTLHIRDTATIKDGRFHFRGKLERPVQGVLSLESLSTNGWLYLDTGNIIVTAKADTFSREKRLINSLTMLSVKGSLSDSLQRNIFDYWQSMKALRLTNTAMADSFYQKVYGFVKRYPDHNLGSEILRDADLFSYHQANQIFNTFSVRQQENAATNGVTTLLKQLERTEKGSPYCFKPQQDTAGKVITGKEKQFKYLLVEFWASWCAPCREENPRLKALYSQYKDRGFDILGISLDEDKKAWINAIKKDGLPWQQIADLKGFGNEIAQYYFVRSIAFNLLLDEEGKIITKGIRGPLLDAQLAALMPGVK
ncbi:TlpA disulfide reductase family protein [Chitinophaga sp. S165]|uniref:TlpA disulfide reductase family protein n=1 Tax=Chitinophaga sp. S165 TaxID=2135462 RepID=UPI000D70A6E4|nr:TlpA disulfide reductase family protein [Chitinophaga sp. S165]PWV48907.1 thiol-disulfide isomerase/thioredoxin [Chitinophaga sp. S165]